MFKLYQCSFFLVVLAGIVTSCAGQPDPLKQAEQEWVEYRELVGKSLTDLEVRNFTTGKSCEITSYFQLCKEAGIALWLDEGHIVGQIFLYLNNEDGFTAFEGKLPFGLRFYDTLGAVEYKLNRQSVGNNGRPDEAGTPDHLHYWAIYKQYGVTIIYNSPFADEDATIYAVLVSE